VSRVQDRAMFKKTVIIALSVLLVVLSSGCAGGGTPPTLRESVANLDAALAKYDGIMGLYSGGNYEAARQEYIAVAATFHDCQSALETASKDNLSAIEKRNAGNLAGCCKQFAYGAQYMRDACTEALKPGENNAYLMEASAEEYVLTARNSYQTNREELDMYWNSPH
jgi:hypothetical protein